MWFGYDPLGRLVKRWKSSSGDPNTTSATFFYYDGTDLVQEGPAAGTASNVYVHGGRIDEIVASWGSGVWYNHHYDAQGSCILLSNTSGGIEQQYDYDAFGFPYFYTGSRGKAGSPKTRFLFTGREWIVDMRIYDYRARLYQPELGRFLQPDPQEFAAGDYNLYRYCHNDPVNKSDPTGLREQIAGEFLKDNQWERAKHFDSANTRQGMLDLSGKSEPGRVYGDGPPAAARGKVNWQDTGDRNISREYVKRDDGSDLDARTYPQLMISASSDPYGKLDTLNVELKVDVAYAKMKNGKELTPEQLASTRRKEPAHYSEIWNWGAEDGRDIARKVARQYSGRSAAGAVNAAEAALRPSFDQAVKDSQRAHDWPGGDHTHY